MPLAYKELNKIVRRKCREAKESWMSEKCKEIEDFQRKHDIFKIHKKIKEMTNKFKKHRQTVLRDSDNEIIVGVEDKLRRWTEYIAALYDDDRGIVPVIAENGINEAAPPITKS